MALRYYQVGQGFTEPNHAAMAKLKTVGNGLKRLQAASTLNRKNRLPITPELQNLRQIRHQWENKAQEYEVIMFWAVCCTAFFGFFRLGEILLQSGCTYDSNIHLSVGDVAVENVEDPKMVQISLKHSKTDQFGQGSKIYLGRTRNDLCPVAAILAYLVLRGNMQGPIFRFQNGSTLTKDRFITVVREVLQTTGIDATSYSGHSYRIGAATTAASIGVEDSMIKALGRWNSNAFQAYIRIPRDRLAAMTATLSRNNTA